MAELTEVRCYQCGQRIGEGQIVRRNVTVLIGDAVQAWARESFCPACISVLESEALANQQRRATDRYHEQVGYAVLAVLAFVGLTVLASIGAVIRSFE